MAEDFLKEVVNKIKEKVGLKKNQIPLETLKERIKPNAPLFSFYKSISKRNRLCLIAELKRASPSKGVLRDKFFPLELASAFKEAGADALSVLTEEEYFQGNISYIPLIKEKINISILRKDFIVDQYQLYESRAYMADAILLLAELFSKETLSEYLDLAEELGLDCLLEVNNEKELKKVLSLKKAKIIGINNRNLHTLQINLKTTERLFPLIPKERTVVVESGISSYHDVLFFKILGVNAILIGEVFMMASDIKQKVREVMGWH
ncbi:MAG: indole-3-glycerol phosphate synthase TrpC [Candidatus Omnitrophica bacterium]|nr:indole-3-glycerol phosphate synthase TrpC [Candidatus Omnitrophota bacterium]